MPPPARRLAIVFALGAILLSTQATASMKVLVTVVEQKTGRTVQDLKPADFALWEDKTARRIESAVFSAKPVDVMLVVDANLGAGVVQPLATSMIGELREKEKMAVVAYESSAELVQDFTDDSQLLAAALAKVKPGSSPRVLDGLFAAMEAGFQHATFRKVILLLTSGTEAGGRVHEREVVRMARKNRISIFPLVAAGNGRAVYENLARQTAGASFLLRDLQREGEKGAAGVIFTAMRSTYTLTITGNLGLGDKLRVEVKRPVKVNASVLSLE